MIFAILGRPGGGKSYEATRYHILTAILEDKRKVVTNIPVNKDYIAKIHGREYADLVEIVDGSFHSFGHQRPFSVVEDFLKWDEWKNEKGQGALFLVDESHLSLGRDAKKETLEYLSMHRHYGHDIGLLTQNQRKLNRDLRDMVEVAYYCAKMSTFGKEGYVRKTFHGLDDMRNHVHLEERSYDKEYFQYYQSHTKSNKAIQEADVKDSGAKLNPYKKVTYAFFGISALIFGVGIFNSMTKEEPETFTEKISHQKPVDASGHEAALNNQPLPTAAKPKPKPEPEPELSENEKMAIQIAKASREYHPFNKVQLHIEGFYDDVANGDSKIFFSASRNGQRLFSLGMKDLLLAGYEVSVLGDCAIEIKYYNYQDFLTCDTPTIGVSESQVAKN